jgi:type IV secretion system protein VirD4
MSARTTTMQIASALMLTIAALWAGTQWAAAMLGYQAALGTPWVELLGVKVYAPWQLFVWWLAFDAQAPDVFVRAGAVAAFGGLASGAVAIGGTARRASLKKQATTYGSARWADGSDVKAAQLQGDQGVVLGVYQDRYLRHDGPEHVLAVAPTRSGKGVGLVLPTLLTWPGSTVVHDIKGENWAKTAGFRAQAGHLCFKFSPVEEGNSSRFNPLAELRLFTARDVSDAQNVADMIGRAPVPSRPRLILFVYVIFQRMQRPRRQRNRTSGQVHLTLFLDQL